MSDSDVQRFHRQYPETYGAVEVQVFDVVRGRDRCDDYREVWVVLEDCHYLGLCTHFYRDPAVHGGYECKVPGLIHVPDLDLQGVLAAVEDVLRRGAVKAAFEPPDEE
jgi:hypothetical protein